MRRGLRWLGIAALALVVALLAVAFAVRYHDGPLGPIPGGPLRAGELVAGPVDDWTFAAQIEEIELEVDPASPRSITVWCLVHGGRLYIPAAQGERKRWPGQVAADPRVRARIDGKRYDLGAVRIIEPVLAEALTAALVEKYGVDASEGYYSSVAFFRLGSSRLPPPTGGAGAEPRRLLPTGYQPRACLGQAGQLQCLARRHAHQRQAT